MQEEPIQQAVDRLADSLQRSVVINDPVVHMLYSSRHFGDEDEVRVRAVLQREAGSKAVGHVLAQGVSTWTTPGTIPAEPSLGMAARVCAPIRFRGDMLGMLMVIDADGTLTMSELATMTQATSAIAAVMAGEQNQRANASSHAERLVAALIGRDPADRSRAIEALTPGRSTHQRRLRAIALRVTGPDAERDGGHAEIAIRYALSQAPREIDGSAMTWARGSRGVLIHVDPTPGTPTSAEAVADRLVTQIVDVGAGRFTCTAGVGPAVTGPESAWRSYAQADLATSAGSLFADRRVLLTDELEAYLLLLRIPEAYRTMEFLPIGLTRLLNNDKHGTLTATLETYLAKGGSSPAAAQALHVHRTTLYYRLDRIAEISGCNLDDGEVRLTLHLGLKLWRLLSADAKYSYK